MRILIRILFNLVRVLTFFQVFHPMRQPDPDFNPCENNGGCEALCLLVANSSNDGGTGRPTKVCQCPENFLLNGDGLTCSSNCSTSSFNCKIYFLKYLAAFIYKIQIFLLLDCFVVIFLHIFCLFFLL